MINWSRVALAVTAIIVLWFVGMKVFTSVVLT